MNNLGTYTASEARKKLYSLIKEAGKGMGTYEIILRGNEPVVLMSKDEFESWKETLEIMADKSTLDILKKSDEDIIHGRTKSLESISKEMNLDES